MKVAIYLRAASKEGASEALAEQERQLRVFAGENQMDIAGIFNDVGSGLNFDRPGWHKLISELSKRDYDAILVKDFSRIGRDILSTLDAVDKVEKIGGAKVISMNGEYRDVESFRKALQELVR